MLGRELPVKKNLCEKMFANGGFVCHPISFAKNRQLPRASGLGCDPMKEIIEEVLQAEQKVDGIVREAREKASQIKRSAEKDVSETISEAQEKAREIMLSRVEEAKKEAERIRREKLEEAERQREELVAKHEETIESLVDQIRGVILKTGYGQEA